MDEIRRALLGDRAAQERLTERGVLLPCHCGGEMEIMVPEGIVPLRWGNGNYGSGRHSGVSS